jgi:hypothetical protein
MTDDGELSNFLPIFPNRTIESTIHHTGMEDPQQMEHDPNHASEWRKYKFYDCEVDPEQDDKASEMKLGSLAR